jgi:bifunctional aspartokinase / homoserine dehydrogenase 1
MIVLKFGGSSVADPAGIKKVAAIIKDKASSKPDISVVVSAQSGVTDQLAAICKSIMENGVSFETSVREIETRHLSAARELIPVPDQPAVLAEIMSLCNQLYEIVRGASMVGEVTARTRDLILSFGEQLSAFLLYQVVKREISGVSFSDARTLIKTDSGYGRAGVDFESTNKLIAEYYSEKKGIVFIAGFIASTLHGQTTTLGRNGSDYTASILGAALNAESIEIWTDTDGVMTADPTYVKEARNIVQLSYNEAMELSHFGAKVIFPASLQPAMEKRIPITVRNTFKPDHPGTLICIEPLSDNGFIKGITSLGKVCLISVEGCGMVGVSGIAARMFTALSANNISVILISQASSEHSICISLLQDEAEKATSVLRDAFYSELKSGLINSVISVNNLAIVAVVGEKMKNTPGVAAKVFEPLGRNGINIRAISQGSSELNISFVVNENDLTATLCALHDSLFNKN